MNGDQTDRKCYDCDESSDVHDLEAVVCDTAEDCCLTGSHGGRHAVTARSYRLRATEATLEIGSLDENVLVDNSESRVTQDFTFRPADVGAPSERELGALLTPVDDPGLPEAVIETRLLTEQESAEEQAAAAVYPQVELKPDQ